MCLWYGREKTMLTNFTCAERRRKQVLLLENLCLQVCPKDQHLLRQ